MKRPMDPRDAAWRLGFMLAGLWCFAEAVEVVEAKLYQVWPVVLVAMVGALVWLALRRR